MLQNVHGGATARPFRTHMNAFDLDLYLRIAPELFLKRCIVGGLDRVFEINRNFRNEGADSSHSPEFAMLEFYAAYGDYSDGARITRELIQECCTALFGDQTARHHDGTEIDLSGEWPQVKLYSVVSDAVGEQVTPQTPIERLRELAAAHEIGVDPAWLPGKVVEELFEALVQHTLQSPTFVMDYPVDTSPLTRAHRTDPGVAEKWDLYIGGIERGTGYSELVDPVVQRERLTQQALLGAAGDAEAMALDEDFLEALEYGMPPTAGVGIGIDRLMMTLTGLGIRETILFPLVRPLHQ
jgi:lysyl-tRNA synthetase class 2